MGKKLPRLSNEEEAERTLGKRSHNFPEAYNKALWERINKKLPNITDKQRKELITLRRKLNKVY